MFITSKNAIVEAIGKNMVDILYVKYPLSKREKDIIKLAEKNNVLIKSLDKDDMLKTVGKIHSIAANTKENADFSLDYFVDKSLEKYSYPLIFILDSITDVHNFGAIIRNAYFFNSAGIIIPKDNCAPINSKVYEISEGAAYHLPISVVTNLSRTLDFLKERGFWIYYASEKGDMFVDEFKFNTPVAIILGNEHSGVRDILKNKSDGSIRIRSYSGFDSLNVSAASAILSYAYRVFIKNK